MRGRCDGVGESVIGRLFEVDGTDLLEHALGTEHAAGYIGMFDTSSRPRAPTRAIKASLARHWRPVHPYLDSFEFGRGHLPDPVIPRT